MHERPRTDSRWDDLERLRASHPMMDAVIDEVQGRRIRIGNHWLSDFASCNYLGFDLHPEIIASVEPAVQRWGTHPSWSRLLGNPRPYVEIEERLTELLGAPDTLVLPTITLITYLCDPSSRWARVRYWSTPRRTRPFTRGPPLPEGRVRPCTGSGPTTPNTWRRCCVPCPPTCRRSSASTASTA